jgi:hypothetical protein
MEASPQSEDDENAEYQPFEVHLLFAGIGRA